MAFMSKLGFYLERNLRLVPFRHHLFKNTWKVLVNKYSPSDEIVKSENFNVIAYSPLEAVSAGVAAFERWEEQQNIIKKREEDERREKLQNSRTKREPSLDLLQHEANKQTGVFSRTNLDGDEKSLCRRIREKKR